MNKTIILVFSLFMSLLFNSLNIHSQSLEGYAKYGGKYKEGEPFSLTFRSIILGTSNGASITLDTSDRMSGVMQVFFNYNSTNNIKVIFPDGNSTYIKNISNIVSTSYRQEAEGSIQDGSNNMTIHFPNDSKELTLIMHRNSKVYYLTMPLK